MTAASFGSQKWAHWQPCPARSILRVSLGRDGLPVLHLSDEQLHRRRGQRRRPPPRRRPAADATSGISRFPGAFPQYRPHHARASSPRSRPGCRPASRARRRQLPRHRHPGVHPLGRPSAASRVLEHLDAVARMTAVSVRRGPGWHRRRPGISARRRAVRPVPTGRRPSRAATAADRDGHRCRRRPPPPPWPARRARRRRRRCRSPRPPPSPRATVGHRSTDHRPTTADDPSAGSAGPRAAPPADPHGQGAGHRARLDRDPQDRRQQGRCTRASRSTTLDRGPGHWPGTAMPGEVGNVVVGGHRTSHDKPFRNIDQLVAGDEVIFTTDGRPVRLHGHGDRGRHPGRRCWIIDQTPERTATLFACPRPARPATASSSTSRSPPRRTHSRAERPLWRAPRPGARRRARSSPSRSRRGVGGRWRSSASCCSRWPSGPSRRRRQRAGLAFLFGAGWMFVGMCWMWFLTVARLHRRRGDLRRLPRGRRAGRPRPGGGGCSAGRRRTRSPRRSASSSRSAASRWPASASARRRAAAAVVRVGGAMLLTWVMFQLGFALGRAARPRDAGRPALIGVGGRARAAAAWRGSPRSAPAATERRAARHRSSRAAARRAPTRSRPATAPRCSPATSQATRTIAPGSADLVVWPENVVDVHDVRRQRADRRDRRARRRGSARRSPSASPRTPARTHFLNAQVVVAPDGTITSRYDKVRRVPFGEYMPLRGLLEAIGAPIDQVPRDAVAGTGPGRAHPADGLQRRRGDLVGGVLRRAGQRGRRRTAGR